MGSAERRRIFLFASDPAMTKKKNLDSANFELMQTWHLQAKDQSRC